MINEAHPQVFQAEKGYQGKLLFSMNFQVGPVTILVNNAGIVSGNTVLDTPDAK